MVRHRGDDVSHDVITPGDDVISFCVKHKEQEEREENGEKV